MAIDQFTLTLFDKDLLGTNIVGTNMEGRKISYKDVKGIPYNIPASDIEAAGYRTVPQTIELKTVVSQNPDISL